MNSKQLHQVSGVIDDNDHDADAADDTYADDSDDADDNDAGMAPVATGLLMMAKTVTAAPRYLVLCISVYRKYLVFTLRYLVFGIDQYSHIEYVIALLQVLGI